MRTLGSLFRFRPMPYFASLLPTRGIDHGPQMLLGTRDATLCRKWSGKRYVEVFASHNVADDTKLLHDLLESSCQDEVKKACSDAPAGLHIPRMKTDAGRLDHPEGSVRIIVVTQAGKPDPDFDASVPSINYTLTLNTDQSHLDEDLTPFRAMLKHGEDCPSQSLKPARSAGGRRNRPRKPGITSQS